MITTPSTPSSRKRVVIVGAGFGGINAAKQLRNTQLDVTIVDRNNYHQFQPLLYQVATAGLEPETIASPIRSLLHKSKNISYQMADVTGVDFEKREVLTNGASLPYDYLIIAAGSASNFFGNTAVEERAYGMKDLREAVALRNQILWTFEAASRETDAQRRKALLTFVVVGGGPTGVELSGALTELIKFVMTKDYPKLDVREAKVIMLEAMDRILAPFPTELQQSALKTLKKMGVEIHLGDAVTTVTDEHVELKSGTLIPTSTVIWSAGVKAAALASQLGLPTARAGRVKVGSSLQVEGHPNVFVVGDIAYLEDDKGNPYPMVAPVAIQQGSHAAKNLLALEAGASLQPFKYFDRGSMAVIGRTAAVASTFGVKMTGFFAWSAWLFVHVNYLQSFRNQIHVALNWVHNFFTMDRGVRLLTEDKDA